MPCNLKCHKNTRRSGITLVLTNTLFMIKLPRLIIIVVILCITAAFANYLPKPKHTPLSVIPKEVCITTPKVTTTKIVTKELPDFLNQIGKRESSNRYNIVNKFGYMGKYQFGRKTLNKIGFKHVSNTQFLSNPAIQEAAMLKLLKSNKRTLRRQIKKYVNTRRHGVFITESGLLAAAHLAGAGNVRKFLRNGKDKRDGLGTPLTEYLTKFGGYNLASLN